MALKLDLKDRKILTLLDENSSMSNSQISRKVGLSKPAVEYRLERFEKNNVILSYYTVVNFTKLGYSQYKIYFKFQNIDIENEKKIIDYWKKDSNSVWVAETRGKWDLAVSIVAENNFRFGKILDEFMNKFSKFILEKDVLLLEYSPLYSRGYMAETKPKEFLYGIPTKVYVLDETDRKILNILSTNARIPIIEMAEKTKLTRDVINYRIKKLTKEDIIVQYRCYLNLHNIGINHYKIIFRTKNFNENSEKEIREYVARHKKATQFLKIIGSWDIEIEFETENEDELYKILTDIRKKFSSIIRDFDILRITETFKLDFYPFQKRL
ncbi:winged helix-turn-helix transcriptional regulator [Candidatus Pacearchaeota archaeon]|nr:winged helix-turn-helix transcriptional regulator [Candidatus Pacearchaeota archaeon]